MSNSPLLTLPYLAASQAQKHVTLNEALSIIDGLLHLSVLTRTSPTPPVSPADGDRYLVAASPTGVWVGHAEQIALRVEGAWRFLTPRTGWRMWVADEALLLAYDGSLWQEPSAPSVLQNLSLLGVNTTADATNKLSVSSSAILFDNVGDDVQCKINKAATGDTASLLFQTGYSGRAEIGLAGDDDLHFKVSSTGSTFNESLVVAASTGQVTVKNTVVLDPQATDPATPGNGQLWYNSTTGKFRGRQNGVSLDVIGAGGGLADGDKGDITVSGSGAIWDIDAGAVTNDKLANISSGIFKARVTSGAGDVEDVTGTQATALLDEFTSGSKGLVPASGGSAATYLDGAGGFTSPLTMPYVLKTAAYTVVAGDRGKTIDIATNAVTLSLDAAATLGDGFYFFTENSNTTAGNYLTIDPNGAETIDGLSTLVDPPGIERMVMCDGTCWRSKIMAGSNVEPVYTPAAMAANNNDYDPLVKGASGIVRVSASATIQVTGLVGGAQGARRVLVNVGTIDILLKNENASSTAANRFNFPKGSFILGPNQSIELAYDVASSRWRPTTMPDARQKVYLAANVVNNNGTANTLADVTGLKFPAVAGQLYKFQFYITYTSAATTTGSRWAINGPAITLSSWVSRYSLTATTETVNNVTAYNSPAASNASSAATGGNRAEITGLIKVSAGGDIIARFASEVASSAITAEGGAFSTWVEYEAVGD